MSLDRTDYALTPAARDVLMGATSLPADLRALVLRHFLADHGAEALIEAFAQFIGLANSVVANNREMIEIILICDGGMSDREAEKANLPTVFGALNGLKIAEGLEPAGMCEGCAFRVGAPANQSPCTTVDADHCAEPGEVNFLCHAEGLDDRGEPTRGCAGWAQLRARRKAVAA